MWCLHSDSVPAPPIIPKIPGQEDFQGQVLHSTSHHSARDHLGKKVFIIGACNSAHDIASDYVEHGVDVTIFQRSSTFVMSVKEAIPRLLKPLYWQGGPPTEEADRLFASMPIRFMKLLAPRLMAAIHEADKELLQNLKKIGYRINFGKDESGFFSLVFDRASGYYIGAVALVFVWLQ
ncbi:hypothetical protein NM688_g9105 [Phlebia brevispora]|uniref:Uncharacterized protein n=1 Tax=Phlebia brevispora TaxID=194682 RepID=A0ACC1RJC7_9APHY|nr:hypothetical protein NM688_g9105 [Phlebia brevispora]